MYSHIKGTVDELFSDRAVIEACGVGYELYCSRHTLSELSLGKTAKLYVHMNIVQDAVSLYGFHTDDERAMFRRLIGITRVGAKLAIATLSVLTPNDISLAVLTENPAAFDGVPGLGKKMAARIILELKEKVDGAAVQGGAQKPAADDANGMRKEAIEALVALGYDGATAGRTVAEIDGCARVEDMIMKALRVLSAK